MVGGGVVAGCVGVAVLEGLGLCVAGILAVAKPSGLALAWSSELLAVDGTAARVAASGTFGVFELSGDGTAPTARPPRRGFC
jgi:hypothetical protein